MVNANKTVGRECGHCCTKLIDFNVSVGRRKVLEDINLHIHCGELTAIIGPNGAGKSTLFRAIIGETPYSGRLEFRHAVTDDRFASPRIGYVPQRLDLDSGSAVTVLDLFATSITRRPIWIWRGAGIRRMALDALALVESGHLVDRLVGQLSGGEQQRVLLALAMTPMPDLLLLDEPVSGVDLGGMELFYHMVSRLRRSYHLAILLISHDLTAIAHVADRVIFLMNRQIRMDGRPAEVLGSDVVRRTFGYDYSAHRHGAEFIRAVAGGQKAVCDKVEAGGGAG